MNRLLWALAAIGSIVVLLWAGIVFNPNPAFEVNFPS